MELVIEVEDLFGDRPIAETRIVGPQSSASLRKVTIEATRPYPRLRGQLNDETASPMPEGKIPFVMLTPESAAEYTGESEGEEYGAVDKPLITKRKGQRFAFSTLTLGASGQFEFPWPWGRKPQSGRKIVIARNFDQAGRPFGAFAEVNVDRALDDEGLDVGQLFMNSGPLLARGRVRDERYQPIAGVVVYALAEVALQPDQSIDFGNPVAQVRTNREGEFVLRGHCAAAELILVGNHPAFVGPSSLVVPRGALVAEIQLGRTDALKGSLKIESPQLAWAIELRAKTNEADNPLADYFDRSNEILQAVDGEIGANGSFIFDGLKPGDWHIEILVNGKISQTFENVQVRAGETNEPAELQSIRLLEEPRIVRVEVQDSEGRALYGNRVMLRKEGEQPQAIRLDEWGRFLLTDLPTGNEELSIVAPGRRPKDFHVADDVMALRLLDSPTIRFDINDFARFKHAGYSLELALRGSKNEAKELAVAALPNFLYLTPIRSGQAKIRVSGPGTYEIFIRAHKNDDGTEIELQGLTIRKITLAEDEYDKRVLLGMTDRAD